MTSRAIHLNHAGTSWPKPPPVRAAVEAVWDEPRPDWPASFERRRNRVARWLGLPDPTRLLLTPGATSALALAVSDLPWEPGDHVVTSGFEHHALMRPLRALAHRGVQTLVVPPGEHGPLDLAALDRALDKKPRLVALSAASNVTGTRLPVDEVVSRAHAAGALVLVDAAQEAGWLPLSPVARKIDLMAFAGHKGPQAPWGIGGLYVAPDAPMVSPLALCEVGTACAPMPSYCDAGSVDRAALAGLCAGLDWLDTQPRRLARARDRIARLQAALPPEIIVHGERDARLRMPTLAITHPAMSPRTMAQVLADRGVFASAGTQCAPTAHQTLGTHPDGVLRLSLGPTTTDDDVDEAVDALVSLQRRT